MSIMPVVIIKMAKGRTIEQKKILIREFTKTITDTLGVYARYGHDNDRRARP